MFRGMTWGVFEFRIKFAQIFFPGFDFSEKTRFVFLLISLPGENFVKRHDLSFYDGPAGGKLCEKLSFCYF